eukprot:m.60490 g.60490  ORF g.60490 m.60490 type:complete len:496 (+) comp13097_c0_seq2:179-1666(+)
MPLFGFAGSLFVAPDWVDKKKPPGHTSQSGTYGHPGWWKPLVTGQSFLMSPNLAWFSMSLALYVVFPYDLDAAKTLSWSWVSQRLVVNSVVAMGYIAFWSATMYFLSCGKRKFKPEDAPSATRLFHNVWFTWLGVAQWTVWEVIFVNAYATDKLPFVSNAELLASPAELAKNALAILLVPMYREIQFYFAHKLIHCRALYKYVHSLHHRNVDPDPWAGLCMHPIEHIYYIACVGPSLYLRLSPLVMLWNGWHTIISPAAGHSGWEDNWQSDQHHYIHHAKFECNYGSVSFPLDKWFGTFREKLGASKEYKGAWSEGDADVDTPAAGSTATSSTIRQRAVAAAVPHLSEQPDWQEHPEQLAARKKRWLRGSVTLTGMLPRKQDGIYFAFTTALAAILFCAATHQFGVHHWRFLALSNAQLIASLVSIGPIIFGLMLLVAYGDKYPWLWPFHRDPKHILAFHTIVGILVTVVPAYHLIEMLLAASPAESPYFYLRSR